MGVSVIVCTYNGADRIDATLQHLLTQDTRGIAWEVIVVNNASTDETGKIIHDFEHVFKQAAIVFRVVSEPNQGKIHALTNGISHSKFGFFIICDDDNRLAPDYVWRVYEILRKDPGIGAVGGRSTILTDSPVPEWFGELAGDYAVGEQANHTADVTSRGYLWGAGMGSRVELFKDVYKEIPSLLTGRKGGTLLAGEDAEYCVRIIAKGYRLLYDSSLLFEHFVPAYRLTPGYRDGVLSGIKESMKVIDKYFEALLMQKKIDGKPFQHWRLTVLTPLRIQLARTPERRQRQENKLQFLLPPEKMTDEDMRQIKKFIGL